MVDSARCLRNLVLTLQESTAKWHEGAAPFSELARGVFNLPAISVLDKLISESLTDLRQKLEQLRDGRIQQSKAQMNEDRKNSFKSTFARLRDCPPSPVACVSDSGGQRVFEPSKIHEAAGEFWVDRIYRKYQGSSPPDWETFLQRFRDAIGPAREEMKIRKIRLEKRRKKIKSEA